MNKIVRDFFELGVLRVLARALMGIRGLLVITRLAPVELGEYTIWLLFIFYFSVLDFGIWARLERDIPHYRGLKDDVGERSVSDKGWSLYSILSFASAVLLMLLIGVLYRDWTIAVLLALYILTDKAFRYYEITSRINFQYRDNGIALFIISFISLVIIWLTIAQFKIVGILWGFIIASVVGAVFLHVRLHARFSWWFRWKDSVQYVIGALPLTVIIYATEFYHMAPLMVLALMWDKETLGYFAFAYRFFQICLAVFPYLIQNVMRTRMYYLVAQNKDSESDLKELFFPIGIYSYLTTLFWVLIYWLSDWAVGRFIPVYTTSVVAVKLLVLALLPLGILKICSDYLISVVHNRIRFVTFSWGLGILTLCASIYFLNTPPERIPVVVPAIYLATTMILYVLIVGKAFSLFDGIKISIIKLIYLISPLILAGAISVAVGNLIPVPAAGNRVPNIFSLLVVLGLLIAAVQAGNYMFRNNRLVNVFFKSDRSR